MNKKVSEGMIMPVFLAVSVLLCSCGNVKDNGGITESFSDNRRFNMSIFNKSKKTNSSADIAEDYWNGLKKAYTDNGGSDIWNNFENVKYGASSEDIERLRSVYPDVPQSLIELLLKADGTYYRKYGDEEIKLFFLGSDMEEYPYYFFSVEQMLDADTSWLDEYVDRVYDDTPVDKRIINDSKKMNWLHFSDDLNNGGSSTLYIDFSPSPKGTKGQIIRYVHDPDELTVIADSFDDYLKMLIDKNYDFINKDTMEWYD